MFLVETICLYLQIEENCLEAVGPNTEYCALTQIMNTLQWIQHTEYCSHIIRSEGSLYS